MILNWKLIAGLYLETFTILQYPSPSQEQGKTIADAKGDVFRGLEVVPGRSYVCRVCRVCRSRCDTSQPSRKPRSTVPSECAELR